MNNEQMLKIEQLILSRKSTQSSLQFRRKYAGLMPPVVNKNKKQSGIP